MPDTAGDIPTDPIPPAGDDVSTPPRTQPPATPPTTRREAREAVAREAAAREAAARETAAPESVDKTPQPPAADATDALPVEASPEISLEALFTGRTTTDVVGAVPARISRRKKRRRRWIALGVSLAVVGGIAASGWYVWSTYEPQIRAVMGWEEPKDYAAGLAHGSAIVTVVDGDNGASISRTLASAGVTKTPTAFYDMLVASGKNPTFYPGVYKLQKEMTSAAALAELLDPASKMENSVLLREGITEKQTLKAVSDAVDIPLKDLEAAVKDPSSYGVDADSLEGWLFPAVYTFPPGTTASDVIKTLVARTTQALDDAGVPEADRQRVLTIASIIQREARSTQDFYKVSRVIENRLNPDNKETFGKLQMDSTAQYGYGEMHDGSASSSAAALADPNPWNTYVHAGLPAGPIANPGDVAIEAAMHPAPGPWLYFVTVNMDTGETVFSVTYAEHEKAIEQMRTWCAAHPDSGC